MFDWVSGRMLNVGFLIVDWIQVKNRNPVNSQNLSIEV
jgi:hypothetical protein